MYYYVVYDKHGFRFAYIQCKQNKILRAHLPPPLACADRTYTRVLRKYLLRYAR